MECFPIRMCSNHPKNYWRRIFLFSEYSTATVESSALQMETSAGLAHIESGSTLALEPEEPQTLWRHGRTEEVTSHTSPSWCKLCIYLVKCYLHRCVAYIIHGGLCLCLDAAYRHGMVHSHIKSIIIISQQGFCCCLLFYHPPVVKMGLKRCCYCYTGTLVSLWYRACPVH